MPTMFSGVGWHLIGAACAATFYAPIEKVKRWSWETTWVVAGIFSWILLPITVSAALLPNFLGFYASTPISVLAKVFLFGCMWGMGNINYGLTMRYLGMSLGIGISIGVTLVVGTLIPPLVHGELTSLFLSKSGFYATAGICVALLGIAVVSFAGHQKERGIGLTVSEFDMRKGLLLAVMCGIFSAGMSFAIDAARPMQAAALTAGVRPLYAALPSYVVIMGGGALINFAYCFSRLAGRKELSLRDDLAQPNSTLLINGVLAATGGIMWYLQFFFYAWGSARIPAHLFYVNWMLHMSGYVLCGGLIGLILGEWKGAGTRPVLMLWTGMVLIILAANLVGLGMAS